MRLNDGVKDRQKMTVKKKRTTAKNNPSLKMLHRVDSR